MYDVVAMGELLIDFAMQSADLDGYPTMAAHPGGAPANFLAALNAYGAKTAMLGKVGSDSFGHMLLGTLERAGIATEGVIMTDKVFTTLSFVTFDSKGDRAFSFARKPGADTTISSDEVRYDMIEKSTVFHFGTLSLTDDPAKTATQAAVAFAKEHGKYVTFDPNLRKPLWSNPETAKEQMLWGLQQADIVKISDEEAEFLWGVSPEDAAQKILSEYRVKLVFVTCGADGCVYQNANAKGWAPSLTGIQVKDTTGAGDIFGGSAIGEWLKTGKAPDELQDEDLKNIVRFACTAAALSTTKAGGVSSVPRLEEVQNLLV